MPEVLLIGWDGAGWNQIHPLLDAGAMPNLARLVETGVMGRLNTLTPLCPSLLWTSIATGQFADRHGVLDAVEPDPRTGGLRPTTRASLQSAQVWDILAREGVKSRVIGWPVTHPSQPDAVCVSDGFPHGIPGSVHPPALESTLLPLRFQPQEWTGADLQLFVPALARIDQDKDKRLARLAVLLAEDVSRHAAATALMESSKAGFTAVWFGAIGQACALFPAGVEEIYQEAVNGVYRFLDLFLGRLLLLAGPEAVVMLVSDRAAAEAEWNSSSGNGPQGMLCAAGPGIVRDELSFGAGLLDIAPTILSLFGIAPASGMAGRAIPEISPAPPKRAVRPRAAAVPQAIPSGLPDLERELLELERFGYIDTVAAAAHPEAEAAAQRRDLHLARVLLAQGRAAEALPTLERLAAKNPQSFETRIYFGHACFLSGRYSQCRAICESLLAEHPDSPFVPLARAHLAIAEGDYAAAMAQLETAGDAGGMTAALDAAVGEAYLKMRRWPEAASAFRSAIAKDAAVATARHGLAQALLAAGEYAGAAEAALDALGLRYDLADAHQILGQALSRLGREEAAAEALATAEKLRGAVPAA